MIGPKGSTLSALVPNRDKVQIEFDESGNIFFEGSPEEVKTAQAALSAEVRVPTIPTICLPSLSFSSASHSKVRDSEVLLVVVVLSLLRYTGPFVHFYPLHRSGRSSGGRDVDREDQGASGAAPSRHRTRRSAHLED